MSKKEPLKTISFKITLDRLKRIEELKKLLRIQNRSQLLNWAIDCYSDAKIEKKLPMKPEGR